MGETEKRKVEYDITRYLTKEYRQEQTECDISGSGSITEGLRTTKEKIGGV